MGISMLALGTVVEQIITSVVIMGLTFAAACAAYKPVSQIIRRQETMYASVLQRRLLLDIRPRLATMLSIVGILVLGGIGYLLGGNWLGALFGVVVGLILPTVTLRLLRRRHLARLESQLVAGIRTLSSGVRAGLNLVQSMQLVARDGPSPLRQEFAHLLREYEYGVPLEETMDNAADRIGSGDFRLLFAALQTHRQRGGDLGETLDRIGESIREIQRLENRVRTLTAQGRATARWLGAMPLVIMAIVYFLVDDEGVRMLFADNLGKVILTGVVILNIAGFLWVRKIVAVDI
jgi:tight adherence protein B